MDARTVARLAALESLASHPATPATEAAVARMRIAEIRARAAAPTPPADAPRPAPRADAPRPTSGPVVDLLRASRDRVKVTPAPWGFSCNCPTWRGALGIDPAARECAHVLPGGVPTARPSAPTPRPAPAPQSPPRAARPTPAPTPPASTCNCSFAGPCVCDDAADGPPPASEARPVTPPPAPAPLGIGSMLRRPADDATGTIVDTALDSDGRDAWRITWDRGAVRSELAAVAMVAAALSHGWLARVDGPAPADAPPAGTIDDSPAAAPRDRAWYRSEISRRLRARLEVPGKTYAVRERLSALGCVWYAPRKAWLAPDAATLETCRRIVG